MAPVRRPSITVFVLPPEDRRDQAAQFFRQLGAAARAMGTAEYCEVFAFDDGAMPQAELAQFPERPLPLDHSDDAGVVPPNMPKARKTKLKYALLAVVPAAVVLGAALKGKKKSAKSESGKADPAALDESGRHEG